MEEWVSEDQEKGQDKERIPEVYPIAVVIGMTMEMERILVLYVAVHGMNWTMQERSIAIA